METLTETEEIPVQVYAGAGKLRFSGQLEQGFQTDYSRKFNNYIRSSLAVITLIFAASGLLDFMILFPRGQAVLEVRYFIALPLLLTLTAYGFTSNFWRFQQSVLLAYLLVITSALTLMAAITPPEMSQIYFTGLMVTQMAGLNIMRLQFRFAVIGCVAILMIGLSMRWAFHHRWIQVITDLYFYASVSGISLLSNYFLERSVRKDYLKQRLLDREQQQLQLVNDHLQHLVTSDSLTGIANRRHFDETLQDEWRRAQRGHYPLSLLMIDIDYFKLYNDHYGHQQGDQCLKLVAKILASYSKRAGDLVARYGGEEFAIISAGASYKDAIALAQKVCKSVANTKIPHDASPILNYVTVSVGVATITPLMDQQVSDLISDADKNLYQAKANGRNCVFGNRARVSRLS